MFSLPDDEWSEYVRNGQAFAAEALQLGAGGMFAHTQLFNPVGSGIRVRLNTIEPMGVFGFTLNHNIRRFDTALAVLGAFTGPENLLGGGAAPVAEIRTESRAAIAGSAFWLMLVGGNDRRDYAPLTLEWGHDLLPGQGIMDVAGGAGSFTIAGYLWAEVPL